MDDMCDDSIATIKRCLAQASAGEFASDEDVEAFFNESADDDDDN